MVVVADSHLVYCHKKREPGCLLVSVNDILQIRAGVDGFLQRWQYSVTKSDTALPQTSYMKELTLGGSQGQ